MLNNNRPLRPDTMLQRKKLLTPAGIKAPITSWAETFVGVALNVVQQSRAPPSSVSRRCLCYRSEAQAISISRYQLATRWL